MQAYSQAFARVYQLRWASFAQQVAPRLRVFYETTPLAAQNRAVLDLFCGTGQLALHFLDHGYTVTGLDLSEPMLTFARSQAVPYLVTGQAQFVQADAASFSLPDTYGMVVSTYDAINHLPDTSSLKSCFASVYHVLQDDGLFIFDLNTRYGLSRWTSITVEDTADLMLVTRSLYDAQKHTAYIRISGFLPEEGGLYQRFEQTTYETGFDLLQVQEILHTVGFQQARFARFQDLNERLEEPETESRIFIIAEK
jgi:SAM-dependent methyltransferase